MQRIIIKNFGPIREVDLIIPDFMVMIGPQASGKSTISKAIYFFRSLPQKLFLFIIDCNFNKDNVEHIVEWDRLIVDNFVDLFGKSFISRDFYISFGFAIEDEISIEVVVSGRENGLSVDFNRSFIDGFQQIVNLRNSFYDYIGKYKNTSISFDILSQDDDSIKLLMSIEMMITELFSLPGIVIFLPDSLSHRFLMADFVKDFISNQRSKFSQSLEHMIQEKQHLSNDPVLIERLYLIVKLIKSVIKGEYQYNPKGGRLFYNDDNYLDLVAASSGQKSSLWILNAIFFMVLRNKSCSIFFEEPESHLFPDAQKSIVELIALFFSAKLGNQVVITTHSPYILSSINNLLYAHRVGRKKPEEVQAIIDQKMWLDPKRMGVYFVDHGGIRSIMDDELEMIASEEIDTVSRILNAEFDKLFALEDLE